MFERPVSNSRLESNGFWSVRLQMSVFFLDFLFVCFVLIDLFYFIFRLAGEAASSLGIGCCCCCWLPVACRLLCRGCVVAKDWMLLLLLVAGRLQVSLPWLRRR
ncbi:uncharacterized protein LOC117902905 isoform X1 [Drosophila subobscura]|uniref:uncharacterized protein LOC117902905 isoform X1 n=1 Tax=Drosophila subobscura TaxID=7241 RepID=UPI00155AFA5B|nr:uncharacterized protein LOC117902905 isoform X1 [Drosophila subobscura]